eukprot:m51a1_g14452 hypothetical protein (256) ;mRNA; r:628459-629495
MESSKKGEPAGVVVKTKPLDEHQQQQLAVARSLSPPRQPRRRQQSAPSQESTRSKTSAGRAAEEQEGKRWNASTTTPPKPHILTNQILSGSGETSAAARRNPARDESDWSKSTQVQKPRLTQLQKQQEEDEKMLRQMKEKAERLVRERERRAKEEEEAAKHTLSPLPAVSKGNRTRRSESAGSTRFASGAQTLGKPLAPVPKPKDDRPREYYHTGTYGRVGDSEGWSCCLKSAKDAQGCGVRYGLPPGRVNYAEI